jgi:hypothetical protein
VSLLTHRTQRANASARPSAVAAQHSSVVQPGLLQLEGAAAARSLDDGTQPGGGQLQAGCAADVTAVVVVAAVP